MRHSLLAASLVVLLASSLGLAQAAASSPASGLPPASQPAPTVQERIAAPDGVTVVKLSNGMTVILKPTRTAPVVDVRAYVRAGSLYEGKYLGAGISHLAEHLVAQGAEHDMGPITDEPARQTKKAADRVAEIGGQSNAFTSMDDTCYYISAAAGKALECVDLIAEWMARPQISKADFDREHGVVQRELEMGKDDPSRQLYYTHLALAYGTHPAGVPVIGYVEPLKALTYEDLLGYVRRMYAPQGIIFVVVGDIDAEAVLQRACQAFAGFAMGEAPDLSVPPVGDLAGVQRATRSMANLKESIEELSFQSIPLIHPDLYALDVLSAILGEGEACRLEIAVKRQKELVTSVSSSSWTPPWGRGLFSVSFRTTPDKADLAEAAVLAELKRIAAEGVKADELERAKRQKVAEFIYAQQTADSQASSLASDYLATGDVGFSRRYTDRIQAVTPQDIQQAAKKYFTFDQMAITRLVPAAPPAGSAAASQPAPAAATGPAAEEMTRLPNGLRVVLHSTRAAGAADSGKVTGLVSMAFVVEGGLLTEDEKTNGLGTLMTDLCTKGAGERSAEQIAEFFDHAGGAITGSCGNNSCYWQATVLNDSFPQALEILADVVQRPAFRASELDKLRPVLLARVDQVDEQWSSQIQKFFRSKFFTDSPYRMLPSGSKQALSAATVEQVAAYHKRLLKGGSAVLAIYGDFDAAAAGQQVRKLFAPLPDGKTELKLPPARTVGPAGQTYTLKTDKQVAAIIVAQPGMTVGDLKDRLPIDVLDTIISGYRLPAGWLHEELRGRQLVYVVHAYNWPGVAPGAFVTYAACQPDKAAAVVQLIEKNLRRASDYTPTQKEIDQAVNTILTAELLDNQSMASLALSSAVDELTGLGYDFHRKLESLYHAVRPQDVARVARKYLGGGYVVCVTSPQPPPDGQAASQNAGESNAR